MPFNRQHKTVFLDPDCDPVSIDEKVDIILSPSLYWIKKLSLPLKSLREVKSLLPSIFEEILPEGVYSYSVYKNKDDASFYAFAYEDKKILDLLAHKKISPADIASVRFAQSELATLEHAVEINDTQCLYLKDSIVVLLPSSWVSEKAPLDLTSLSLSKHTIALQQFAHIIDYKSLYGVISVLTVLILLTLGELFITSQRSESISLKSDEIFMKEGLKPTMFENRSIVKKFEKTHMLQTALREHLSDLTVLKLDKGEKMRSLTVKNNNMAVDFSGVSKTRASSITSLLQAKGMHLTQKHQGGTLHLEIKL